jgi:hypothetical protein
VYLSPERAVSGMLAAGGSRVYRLALTGGMRVVLDQGEADFAVDALNSVLKVERTVDAFEYGTETVSLRADGRHAARHARLPRGAADLRRSLRFEPGDR